MARLTELRLSGAPAVYEALTDRRGRHHLAGRASNNRHTPENFAARFWSKVARRGPNDCWLWMGGRDIRGRGQVYLRAIGPTNPKHIRAYASVIAWELTHGAFPDGLRVCHNCPTGDNPRCVNPAHLFLGTQHDNILDSVRKGRYNCFGIQKLNAEQVREIRALAARGLLQKDIATRFGIARNTVSGIVHRKTWDHLDPFGDVLERVPSVQLEIRGDIS